MTNQADGFWVFGYGSLIWRVDFPYSRMVTASIRGYCRRFWQGSPDHRGTPGQPGRVVTLVDAPGATCTGRAYRVEPEHAAEVIAQLDHREQAGYDQLEVPLHLECGSVVAGLVYRAAPGNPDYLGKASTTEIARHIQRSCGPSGSNTEYLLELHAALIDLGSPDPHVARLARLVTPHL